MSAGGVAVAVDEQGAPGRETAARVDAGDDGRASTWIASVAHL